MFSLLSFPFCNLSVIQSPQKVSALFVLCYGHYLYLFHIPHMFSYISLKSRPHLMINNRRSFLFPLSIRLYIVKNNKFTLF